MTTKRTPHPYIDGRFGDQLEMVRPSRERVAVPPLPDGYTLRTFRDGDGAAYNNLFRLGFAPEGTLDRTRAHALPGGFLVVAHDASRELVASAVAFAPDSPRHPHDGGLGWLVTDPAHTRRGLGRSVVANVINRLLDERYAMPWLQTEDDRLPALALYLSLGWQPHLYAEGMTARWRDIFAHLGRAFSPGDGVVS